MAEKTKSNKLNPIVEEAKKRFKLCEDAEETIRRKCLDDLEFLSGQQWSDQALKERAREQRPALVVNRLDQFVQHIANAQRQNRISAKVFPVDDVGDPDTAEVIQGMLRHIEYNSHGTLAYDTAEFYAVAMGFGYWRHITKYCDPRSFEQDVELERVPNPFQVYLGPHTLPDGSDAEFGFFFSDMTLEEYKAEFPDSSLAGSQDWQSTGNTGWLDHDHVRVAEYYTKEYTDDVLVRMADGSAKLLSEMSADDEKNIAKGDDGEPIKRDTETCIVKWYKLNAIEALDETVWPIDKIPIVKVTGHELTLNGKLIIKGIVRNLKDAQRQYNFMLSAQTEAVDSSKGQVVIAEGQEEGHEEEFKNLNRQQVVRYKPTALQGQPLAGPQRLSPNMSIQAMTEARVMAADDLKALTGVYDAALGQKSNETSGRGILARQQQTETANFHFQDNLLLSITHSTKMLVELISEVYDTPRVVRTVGEDESQKVVKINQFFQEAGKPKQFKVSAGKYDVICTAGPSFQTKRQEAADLLVGLAGKVPILMQAAPDLIMKAIDVPYGQEIAERLKKMLPPQLQDQPEGQAEIPPQVQQKMTQMGEMMDHLTKELNAKNELIQSKTLELDSRERIEMAKIEAQIAIAEIDTKAQSAIERTQMFKDIWKQLHTTSADAAMQDQKHSHEAAMASAQSDATMQQQQLAAQQPQNGNGAGAGQ